MSDFPAALGSGDEVIAFDLGGTSFRSALLTREGKLTRVQRTPSINYRSMPGKPAADIVDKIAQYIAETVKALCEVPESAKHRATIAISMGAALNAHTGMLLGSGPILGDDTSPFDLELAIKRYLPGVRATVLNDVTASLVGHSLLPCFRHARRLALLTVSTGIASRTLSCSVPHVPVDPILGIQGEIGHHRIRFFLGGQPLSLKCDCGGGDHLNAFASGNGIKNVIPHACARFAERFSRSPLYGSDATSDGSMRVFAQGLANGDPLCKELLKAVSAPVAEAIKWHFMLDPEIDQLILTGGVCSLLQDRYRSAVLENLNALEFYPLTSGREEYWADRVVLGPRSDDAGLIGAAYVARELPRLHRRESLGEGPCYRVSRQNATDYPVYIAQGIFGRDAFPLDLLNAFDRIILVIDSRAEELYGHRLRKLFTASNRQVETVVLRLSERQKDLAAVSELVSSFDALAIRRRKDLVVAAGGGITLDVAGFAANLYRRGIPCLRLPTTLVAAIDAGIGVKNAVNFRDCKNRLGSYSAPYAVVIDPLFLATLPERQIRNGLSEALKIALVADRKLFEFIEKVGPNLIHAKLQSQPGTELIRTAIRAMLLELSPNLHERILDRVPDYGHTFSPVFEFKLNDLEHGEAVALDMALAAALAVFTGILDLEVAHRILCVQRSLGLPIAHPGVNLEMLARGVADARKHRGGRLRMPLLRGIGDAIFVDEFSDDTLEATLRFIQAWPSQAAVAKVQPLESSLPSVFESLGKRPSRKFDGSPWNLRSHSSAVGRGDV